MKRKTINKFLKNFPDKFKNVYGFIRKNLTKKRAIFLGIFIWVVVIVRILSAQKLLSVSVSAAKYGNLTEGISASGNINADQKATLTFPTAGKVAWVGVSEGQKVNKWQGIASLDKTLLDVAYQQSLSNLRATQATVERVHDAVKGEDVAEPFTTKETRTAAEVANDNAYDAYRAAKYNIENATIVAPFTGVVVKADPAFAGVNVNPGTSSYVLVNPDSLYFEAQVNEIDVAKIKVDQKVTIILDAYPDTKLESQVKQISLVSFVTSTGGTAYTVKISLNQKEGFDLRLGMNGDAEFLLNTIDNVLLVPSTAAIEENGKSFVFVVKDGRANKREVSVGASSIDFTQILSGLTEGETIVTLPPANIKDKDKIKTS